MRILYVAMRYDYGRPEQGDSFEHGNFYDSLRNLGHEIIYFDFMSLQEQLGRPAMNRRLLEIARSERPDLMFCVLFRDELDRDTIRQISEIPETTTLNWFCDDHWRFDHFSRHWAPSFNWVVTTDSAAVAKYASIGYDHVIQSQWACNHFQYRKLDLPILHEVTFVGKPHGIRREIIQMLRRCGIHVRVWGHGWGNGRATQEQMIEIFNQSRINLNLSNASTHRRHKWQRALDHAGHQINRILGRQVNPARVNLLTTSATDQIKGRNFEIPGCGGLLLTGAADNLGDYFHLGQEVVTYRDFGSLVDQIRYYLSNEAECAQIAEAGYRRTLNEHTYAHRFREIFEQIGLQQRNPEHTSSHAA
ncbi:MAG: glycosyltransferase [Pirellulales bacterium]|nr:glycosyltransferase [Pirellulales bacterium]